MCKFDDFYQRFYINNHLANNVRPEVLLMESTSELYPSSNEYIIPLVDLNNDSASDTTI